MVSLAALLLRQSIPARHEVLVLTLLTFVACGNFFGEQAVETVVLLHLPFLVTHVLFL